MKASALTVAQQDYRSISVKGHSEGKQSFAQTGLGTKIAFVQCFRLGM